MSTKVGKMWLIAPLLVFGLSVLGLGISLFAGVLIPFYLLLGFSIVFSVENWLRAYTQRYKGIGMLYRLLLNLSLLASLGLVIWSATKLFMQQLTPSPLTSSVIFLGEIAFLIWLGRVYSKNSWRKPSMTLTIVALLVSGGTFAFAGVQPLASYKDQLNVKWSTYWAEQETRNQEQAAKADAEQKISELRRKAAETPLVPPVLPSNLRISAPSATLSPPPVVPAPTIPSIAPIPQPALKDPSWNQLLAFLRADKTDELPYVFPTFVCDNFASTLQANAKRAGWRCAKIRLDMTGYTDPLRFGIAPDAGHACNAFETTDRGLVYIDCTGAVRTVRGYPSNCDKVVEVKVGGRYVPVSLFPEPGWKSTWDDMGKVAGINVRW